MDECASFPALVELLKEGVKKYANMLFTIDFSSIKKTSMKAAKLIVCVVSSEHFCHRRHILSVIFHSLS